MKKAHSLTANIKYNIKTQVNTASNKYRAVQGGSGGLGRGLFTRGPLPAAAHRVAIRFGPILRTLVEGSLRRLVGVP